MENSIVVGPLLGFENGNIYTVRLLTEGLTIAPLLTSSGIVHPPPSGMAWFGIRLTTSDTPEPIDDGDTVPEMLTPPGGDRYLRTRNFVTLFVGTDEKLWVN